MNREEAIAEITPRLAEAWPPVRVYRFGSAARGDDGPDSDLDFLVVVPDNAACDPRWTFVPGDSRRPPACLRVKPRLAMLAIGLRFLWLTDNNFTKSLNSCRRRSWTPRYAT